MRRLRLAARPEPGRLALLRLADEAVRVHGAGEADRRERPRADRRGHRARADRAAVHARRRRGSGGRSARLLADDALRVRLGDAALAGAQRALQLGRARRSASATRWRRRARAAPPRGRPSAHERTTTSPRSSRTSTTAASCPRRCESLRGQAGGPPRIVVVDDGSTEPGDRRRLAALAADGVEVIRQANRGRARGAQCRPSQVLTPYWLVLDADDRLAAGALAGAACAARARPRARLRVRLHALLRRHVRRRALPGLRPVSAALPAHDRPDRARAARGVRGDRRIRRRVPPLRGLGALDQRPRARVRGPPGAAVALEYRRHGGTKFGRRPARTTVRPGRRSAASTRRSTPAATRSPHAARWGRARARTGGSGGHGPYRARSRPRCTGCFGGVGVRLPMPDRRRDAP